MSRSLQFDIVANDKASAKLKEVQGIAGQFAKSVGGMFAGIMTFQNLFGKAMSSVQEAFSWGSQLKDNAAAVGLSVTQFQQLEFAAKQAGVPVEKLQKAFLDLRKTIRDAQGGNSTAIKTLQAMGYSMENIQAGSVDVMDAFFKMSEAISAAGTDQEKFNIATAVFGDKVAMDLIKVLGDFKNLKQSISETPLISEQDAETLDRFGDMIDKATTKVRVNIAKAASALVLTPEMEEKYRQASYAAFGMVAPPRPTETAAPTPGAKDMAGKLAALGNKSAIASNLAAAGSLPTMAAIGGAAGYRPGGKSDELTTLEKIESNTRPTQETLPNGATDFSKGGGPDSTYNALVSRIRTGYHRRDRAPR